MTKFSKAELLDEAFAVAAASPYIQGKDWGNFGKAMSDAFDIAHPKIDSMTKEQLGMSMLTFTDAAEKNIETITGDADQATDLVQDVITRLTAYVLKPQELKV